MHAVTQQADGEDSRDGAFYVFTASTSECFETLELCINDKTVNVIVDSGRCITRHKSYGGYLLNTWHT